MRLQYIFDLSNFVVFVLIDIVILCPPQPNGNCYYGTYQLSSSRGGFRNQACENGINQDWCTVSYMPTTQQANFGCASNFPIQVGGAVCGEGAGFVNQQGCSMVNTDNGPCYFCCCKGGSCNNPQIFAREASKLPINQFNPQQPAGYGNQQQGQQPYYQIPWYNSANQPPNPFLLLAIIFLVFFFISYSEN